MYEEDRENREDRDQEIERTEIMDDVDEQENAAAVLCCEIGETPDIAEAYRSACRREDKADLARKGASLVLILVH